MSLDLGTLVGYLKLDSSEWTSPMDRAKDGAAGFARDVPTFMAVGTAAIIAGAALVGAALYGMGSQWDEVSDGFRINTTATGDEFDGLVDSAKDVADEVPASLDKIGPTLATLNTRLGLTGDTLETVAGQTLEAGRMMGEDLNLDAATGAFNAFHIEGDAVSGALDTLFQVSQATGIGLNDLIGRVQSAAPITQQLGFSFEETAAMIGSMDKAGLDSQTMIGAMQRGLVNLATPGETAEDAFARVTGQIQGFIESGDEAAAIGLAGEMFGTRGAPALIGALSSGAIAFDDLVGAAGLSNNTIMEVADSTQDFGERWQLFVNDMMIAAEPLATRVFDGLSAGMETVSAVAEPLFAFLAENPVVLEILAAAVGVIAIAFIGLTVATWALNTALLANPITWIVLAIVALIAAVVLLIMNWDELVAWGAEVLGGFFGWLNGIVAAVADWWTTTWDNMILGIRTLWEGFVNWSVETLSAFLAGWSATWTAVGNFISDVWRNFTTGVRFAWETFTGWIMGALTAYVGFWAGIWNGVASFIAGVWANITSGVTTAWNGITSFLSGIPGAVLGFFANAGQWLLQTGRNIIDGLLNGLKAAIGAVWDWITNIGQGIADTFANILGIHSPSQVFRDFGVNIGEGLIEGLEDIQPEVDARFGELVAAPSGGPSVSDSYNSRSVTQHNTILVDSDDAAAKVFDLLDKGAP